MSYAEELMEEFKKEEPEVDIPEQTEQSETQSEQTNEPPKEWSKEPPKEWAKPSETQSETSETSEQTEQTEPSEQPETKSEPTEHTEPQQKPDLSAISKEDKASHAFRRQLDKQKQKYESAIEEMKRSFQTQIDEIKKAQQPKEAPKTRNDFDSDDEYISYLADGRVDAKLAKIEEERAEKERQEAAVESQRKAEADAFVSACREAFPDDEEYKAFESKVDRGIRNGLNEFLAEAPTVRDFIFNDPDGPIVLNEMLTSKDAFVAVMSRAKSPSCANIMSAIAMDAARRGRGDSQPTATVHSEPPKMPSIGKPGSHSGSIKSDIFDSDESVMEFVRSKR